MTLLSWGPLFIEINRELPSKNSPSSQAIKQYVILFFSHTTQLKFNSSFDAMKNELKGEKKIS